MLIRMRIINIENYRLEYINVNENEHIVRIPDDNAHNDIYSSQVDGISSRGIENG